MPPPASKPLPRMPSERAAARDERSQESSARQREHAEKIKQLRECAAQVAETAEGQLLLRHFMTLCGYKKTKSARRYELGADGSPVLVDVLPNATIYNAAKEDVWLTVRELFDKRQLNKIEG